MKVNRSGIFKVSFHPFGENFIFNILEMCSVTKINFKAFHWHVFLEPTYHSCTKWFLNSSTVFHDTYLWLSCNYAYIYIYICIQRYRANKFNFEQSQHFPPLLPPPGSKRKESGCSDSFRPGLLSCWLESELSCSIYILKEKEPQPQKRIPERRRREKKRLPRGSWEAEWGERGREKGNRERLPWWTTLGIEMWDEIEILDYW